MSEPVIVALVSAAALVLVATIGLIARVNVQVTRVRRDAAEAKDQVTNDHSKNLRHELDDRHAETRGWFRRLERSIGGIRDDHRLTRIELHDLSERVSSLEHLEITKPRPKGSP